MNKKLSWLLLSTLLGGAVLTGCSEENPKPTNGEGDQNPTSKNPTELYYANMFGKEAMSTYYTGIRKSVVTWTTGTSRPTMTQSAPLTG